METRTLFALAVVGLLAVPALPGGTALSHRVKYDATGVAIAGANVYTVELHWSGVCTLLYTIILRDATGAVVSSRTFSGFQEHTHPAENGQQPAELHYTVVGFSTTPGVSFNVRGFMLDTVNSAPHLHVAGALAGTYQGMTIAYAVNPGPYTNC